MATFTLTNSAGDIDSALQKVVSSDTTPTDTSPNMVTSGGVKAYVDTEIVAASNLNSAVISTADLIEVNNFNAIGFSTITNVRGLAGNSYNLERESTFVLRTPTSGFSILSVNAKLADGYTSNTFDNYSISLSIDGVEVARSTLPHRYSDTYITLSYSSYVNIYKTVELEFHGTNSSATVIGNVTCVNYQ